MGCRQLLSFGWHRWVGPRVAVDQVQRPLEHLLADVPLVGLCFDQRERGGVSGWNGKTHYCVLLNFFCKHFSALKFCSIIHSHTFTYCWDVCKFDELFLFLVDAGLLLLGDIVCSSLPYFLKCAFCFPHLNQGGLEPGELGLQQARGVLPQLVPHEGVHNPVRQVGGRAVAARAQGQVQCGVAADGGAQQRGAAVPPDLLEVRVVRLPLILINKNSVMKSSFPGHTL
mmetsp:Transcript_13352/g.21895  ORF Transcript_13352/g.21895 Transcript_13352/m.21895 type:complete len:227 (-) Transcript_13352:635-1315(-)